MNRQTIEQAADNYAAKATPSYTNGDFDRNAIAEAFECGANWRINSVWHDVNEEPIYWKLIIRKDILGDYDLGCELKHDTISWAYLDDLVPERKGKEETK